MSNIPSESPLNSYTNTTVQPNMSVNGISLNKSYGYIGVVDALNTQQVTYASPQSTQIIPNKITKLPNVHNNNNKQNYWESPYDVLGSKDTVVIQINLKVPTTNDITFFNYLSFNFADVPANWSVYYLDPITKSMIQLTDVAGDFVGGRTLGLQGYKNGNELGWVHIGVNTQAIGSSLLELRLDRNVKINKRPTETNPFQVQTGYPFLLKNFNIKLNATEWNQVPSTANIATKNQLGLTESYIVGQRDASQIQVPANRLSTQDTSKYWRSEPQPVGDAVVDLYVDLGTVKTIDSIYIDPLYSGVHCNVYYSNDSTIGYPFYCSRAQTTFTQKDTINFITFNNSGQQSYEPFTDSQTGAVFPDIGTSGLITPSPINFNGTSTWAIGLTYAPNKNVVTGTTYTLLNQKINNTDSLAVYFKKIDSTTVQFKATINGYTGNDLTLSTIPNTLGNWYKIIIAYDISKQDSPVSSISVDNNSTTTYISTHTGVPANYLLYAQDMPITIGNQASVYNASPAYGVIRDFWIRQDTIKSSIRTAYFNNPRVFINANGQANTLRGDYCALLMSKLNSNECTYKPNSDYFADKEWTPVQADITLRQATFKVPTFNARYIKLEFTNLYGRVYPLSQSLLKKNTKFFPDSIKNHFQTLQSYINAYKSNNYAALSTRGTSSSSLTNVTNLSPNTAFGSAVNQLTTPFTQGELNNQTIGSSQVYPNASTTIIDPTFSADYLDYIDGTANVGNTSQAIPFLRFRFPQKGKHQYNKKVIMQTWNKAYFVGIKAINFYKTNQDLQDDTEYYYDTCTIAPGDNGSLFGGSFAPFNFNNGTPLLKNYTGVTTTLSSLVFTLSDVTAIPTSGYGTITTETGELIPFQYVGITGTTLNNCYYSGDVTKSISNNAVVFITVPPGYVSNGINIMATKTLTSFDKVNSIQISAVTSDWIPVAPIDQVGLNQSNLSYLNQGILTDGVTPANINAPQQISSFNLSTKVYSFTPITNGQAYGTANLSDILPPSLIFGYTSGMRCSAVARIFLPDTNTGQYQLNLWGTIGAQSVQIASIVSSVSDGVYTWKISYYASSQKFSSTLGNSNNTVNISGCTPTAYNGTWIISTVDTTIAGSVYYFTLTTTRNPTITSSPGAVTGFGAATTGGTQTLLNSQTSIVPLRNWTTLQIPYSVTNNVINLRAEIIQTNTDSSETFYLTMLSAFYHPIGWSYSTGTSYSGVSFFPITTAINNPNAFVSFINPTSTFSVRASSYVSGAYIKALLIRPNYQQNAYTSQVPINYFSDPRTNEVGSRVAPVNHPMFQLSSNYYPINLTLENTSNPGG